MTTLQSPLSGLVDLREADAGLLDKVVARNQQVVDVTSPMDRAALQDLIEVGMLALAEPETGSFLISLGPDARHDGANYTWLQNRLRKFAYVDRVVVAPEARGQGLARRFYAALEQSARAQGLLMLTCEVNCQPDNPASHAFHRALGFSGLYDRDMSPVGQTGKWVRYYAKVFA